MVGVNRPNHLLNAVVKVNQTSLLLVSRLIDWVVTGDPSVVLVVLRVAAISMAPCCQPRMPSHRRKLFPDLDGSVLEVLVHPD